MLESFFTYAGVLSRLRLGPLEDAIEDFAERLVQQGYSRGTAKRYLCLAGQFNRYVEAKGCTSAASVDGVLAERFLMEVPASESLRTLARTAVGHMLRQLEQQYPRQADPAITRDPDAQLLNAFYAHLHEVRGLRHKSCEGVLRLAQRMLVWYRRNCCGRTLSALTGQDVFGFVNFITDGCAAESTRSQAVSHFRAFLRYLHWDGTLSQDLACLVPRVPCRRMARIPEYLPWREVRRVIDATDATAPMGKRDRAILLLLATTGMRGQELRHLALHDVCWRTSELHLRAPKNRRERCVPLFEEAGRALADYLLHGRPRTTDATIFVRHRPPIGPLCSSSVSAIVRQRLARCGLHPAHAGARLLRHSLATRMVQEECPVKQVADLLGHASIDTTAIYVKVALPQLRGVALPFPGGDS